MTVTRTSDVASDVPGSCDWKLGRQATRRDGATFSDQRSAVWIGSQKPVVSSHRARHRGFFVTQQLQHRLSCGYLKQRNGNIFVCVAQPPPRRDAAPAAAAPRENTARLPHSRRRCCRRPPRYGWELHCFSAEWQRWIGRILFLRKRKKKSVEFCEDRTWILWNTKVSNLSNLSFLSK